VSLEAGCWLRPKHMDVQVSLEAGCWLRPKHTDVQVSLEAGCWLRPKHMDVQVSLEAGCWLRPKLHCACLRGLNMNKNPAHPSFVGLHFMWSLIASAIAGSEIAKAILLLHYLTLEKRKLLYGICEGCQILRQLPYCL